ncbi:DUF4349 domain-containing protein [Kineococcus gypseus]|uniref:DUF4349 domain-containing protein n=1 Tax=Kineococcus gypseus TaxID=1637102 RepID=UPI003D7DCFE2
MPRTPTRRALPALLLALPLALGACSGSGAGSSDAAPAAGGAGAQEAASGAQGAAVTAADATAAAPADGALAGGVLPGRAVVSTATLAVQVGDAAAAAERAADLAAAAGGLVTASSTGGGEGAGSARLTVRVPGERLAQLLDDVAALGRQVERSTTAADVTAEVADVDSRVTSAQAVLATFRARLPQATTIPDVLALEGEIARRQADLEALQARQRSLADQVSLATAEVLLREDGPAAAAAAPGGFTGGLAAGWGALLRVLGAAAVALGAVLPFAVPAAALGAPLLVLHRRRARRPAAGS